MPDREFLGRRTTLVIHQFSPHGAHLALPADQAADDANTILLLGSEIPKDAHVGMSVEVFVYLDSEDRPLATTATPMLQLGEVAFLTVKDLTRVGAFVDWGLPKQLLVPFAEQLTPLKVGERHAIGLRIDNTGRLAGTMRVAGMLKEVPDFQLDDWVEGEAWRNETAGIFVILNQRCIGLLPAQEAHRLSRGERTTFRVSRILPDGKIELSLRKLAAEAVVEEAEQILRLLQQADAPAINEKLSPHQIRRLFGISKKAFKRAVGRLLKQRQVAVNKDGNLMLTQDG